MWSDNDTLTHFVYRYSVTGCHIQDYGLQQAEQQVVILICEIEI